MPEHFPVQGRILQQGTHMVLVGGGREKMARWAKAVRAVLEEQRFAEAAAKLEERRRLAAALAYPRRLEWVNDLLEKKLDDVSCPVCPSSEWSVKDVANARPSL